MEDSKEIKTMRYMEWERIKGGINAILVSYWNPNCSYFDEAAKIAEKFIEEFGEKSGIS
jgi:hypothetical protein